MDTMQCKDALRKKGQYFTTNETLQTTLVDFIKRDPQRILEPSVGRGDLVLAAKKKYGDAIFDMYEIDEDIPLLSPLQKQDVCYGDFLAQPHEHTYDTIIGNPPFVKKSKGNLYLSFIRKCVQLLNPGGELVFIVPSDFMKLTSAIQIIDEMLVQGSFTDVYYPESERLFDNASIDIMIFRYCKDHALGNNITINGENMTMCNHGGILTFLSPEIALHGEACIKSVGSMFRVFVGMVSGREEVFKHPELGNVDVLTASGVEKYILHDSFPTADEKTNAYLLENKMELMQRKIRAAFTEKTWYEWGALRNYTTMQSEKGRPCIYVRNITRNKIVAFRGEVQLFSGNLLALVPDTTKVHEEHIDALLDDVVVQLNNTMFRKNYDYAGRFKIGQRQLENSVICIEHADTYVINT